jgi:type IV pilus assembly protein PilV
MSERLKSARVKPGIDQTWSRGFTLLEVMISLVVLAIGVMGVIGLQTQTYKQLQTSQNFSKATLLAGDIADRMLANQNQVIAAAYIHDEAPTEEPSPSCASEACTAAQLAAYDVWYWQAELRGTDPDDGTKVPGSLPAASGQVYTDGGEYIILVRWDDDLDGDAGEECAALDPGAVQGVDDLDCYALNLGCLDTQDVPCL